MTHMVRGGRSLVQKSVSRSSILLADLLRKFYFDPLILFEIYGHVSKSDFGLLFNSSNFRFRSRFLLRIVIGPNWKFEASPSRENELLQTLFWTKKRTLA